MIANEVIFRGTNVKLTFFFRKNGDITIEVIAENENGEIIEDVLLDKSDTIDLITEWLKNV